MTQPENDDALAAYRQGRADGAARLASERKYHVILWTRTSAAGNDWAEVHREPVTARTLSEFQNGEILRRVEPVDQGGLVSMVRLQLVAPDGDVLDTYDGPHPDEGPSLFREVSVASRRSIANVWAALINGADPGPVPEDDGPQRLSGGLP